MTVITSHTHVVGLDELGMILTSAEVLGFLVVVQSHSEMHQGRRRTFYNVSILNDDTDSDVEE